MEGRREFVCLARGAMMDDEEDEAPQMITINGIQVPFTIVNNKLKPPALDLEQRFPLLSSDGSVVARKDRVGYPTDDHPAIIKIKAPAGGVEYLVNPMIPSFQRMQQGGVELSPCINKLLDDYHETLLKHPEIAAYISATGGGSKLPPCPTFVPNMNLSDSSDIATSG